MLKKDELVRKIAKRKGMDERVVRLVADYPLKFVKDRFADDDDWKPIRIRYFGMFGLKRKYENTELSKQGNAIKVSQLKEKQVKDAPRRIK